ncbi:MAG: peroxiredoxin [Elusimicrobiota bacterium]|jgi:peroxiredoxin Q/BCP
MKLLAALAAVLCAAAAAAPRGAAKSGLKPGDPAPLFTTQEDSGATFSLESRRGKWTVLYFYPKSGTPGCTKQACVFRDALAGIRGLGAEIYGVSKDSLEAQRKFKTKHHLNFSLLADEAGDVISAYGTKGMLGMSKRWTFLIDPELTVRWVEKDVDPASDAQRVAAELTRLQNAQKSSTSKEKP